MYIQLLLFGVCGPRLSKFKSNLKIVYQSKWEKTITQIFNKDEVVDIDRFKEEWNNILETKELLTSIRLTCIYESMFLIVAISITGYLLFIQIQLSKCKNNYKISTLKF